MFFWKWTVRVGHKLSARFGFMSPNSMDQNYPTLALIRLIDGSKDVPWMSWVKRSRSGVQNRSRSVSVLPHETSWSRKAGSFLTAVLQNACWNSLKAMPMREGGGGGGIPKRKSASNWDSSANPGWGLVPHSFTLTQPGLSLGEVSDGHWGDPPSERLCLPWRVSSDWQSPRYS